MPVSEGSEWLASMLVQLSPLRVGPHGSRASFWTFKPNLNLNSKVLDFIQFGGPILTVGRTVFEMWLGAL